MEDQANNNAENKLAAEAPISAAQKAGNPLTTTLIVLIVVLLFVMLMLSINGMLFKGIGSSSDEMLSLKSKNSQLRAEVNNERASRGLPPLPEDTRTARTTVNRIQRDANALAAMTGQWQTELAKKDEQLRNLENQVASHSQITQSLYTQISSLQSKIAQGESAASQLTQLANELKIAQNQIATYQKKLAELQGRPTNEQVATLRKQLNDSVENRNQLELKVDQLEEEAKNKVAQSNYDSLAAELAQLKPEFREQRFEIQKLRAQLDRTKLFIESAKDLPAEASRLFARLKTLENVNQQQLAAAYKNIEANLGAKIVNRQTFATGSAQINFDRESIIRDNIAKSQNNDAYFLVVGYASKSGGSEQNKALSSQRATTVASVVNSLRSEGQKVRAVYLGETERFSKEDEAANQICEIWEIKR